MLNILWWSHNVDLICYDKLNDKLDNELKIKAYKKSGKKTYNGEEVYYYNCVKPGKMKYSLTCSNIGKLRITKPIPNFCIVVSMDIPIKMWLSFLNELGWRPRQNVEAECSRCLTILRM